MGISQQYTEEDQLLSPQDRLARCENRLRSKKSAVEGIEKLLGFYSNDPTSKEKTQQELEELKREIRDLESEKAKLQAEIGGSGNSPNLSNANNANNFNNNNNKQSNSMGTVSSRHKTLVVEYDEEEGAWQQPQEQEFPVDDEGWMQMYDEDSGAYYWYNEQTGESQWE